jgi:hypothetical protein
MQTPECAKVDDVRWLCEMLVQLQADNLAAARQLAQSEGRVGLFKSKLANYADRVLRD